MRNYDRAQRIIDAGIKKTKDRSAACHLEEIRLCTAGYAEPGYKDPESGVIAFGNWNKITRYDEATNQFVTLDETLPRVAKLLEKIGVELKWSDEWTECCDCFKAIRTSPDSYGWQRSYWSSDNGDVCHECVKKHPYDYLESLEGNHRSAMTIDIDLAEHSYKLLESDFENGFHPGQDADPKVIAKSLRALGVERFLFTLDSAGQFDISFSVWVHEEALKELDMEKWEQSDKDGPSVSGGLQRALRDASVKIDQLPDGPGVRVAQCDASTGTATAKLVSPQDWVEGKAGV